MRQSAGRSAAIVTVCAIICGVSAALAVYPFDTGGAQDRNRDGRADVWPSYDPSGRLARVAVDTNFDGRSDVEELYERGVLVRRAADQDFNDRIDLIQEFDPDTGHVAHLVRDVDADGVADLLVLFREGQPVYSKWAEPGARPAAMRDAAMATVAERRDNDPLLPLGDPFSAELALRRSHALFNPVVSLSSVPVAAPHDTALPSDVPPRSHTLIDGAHGLPSARAGSSSPRAPPIFDLLG